MFEKEGIFRKSFVIHKFNLVSESELFRREKNVLILATQIQL